MSICKYVNRCHTRILTTNENTNCWIRLRWIIAYLWFGGGGGFDVGLWNKALTAAGMEWSSNSVQEQQLLSHQTEMPQLTSVLNTYATTTATKRRVMWSVISRRCLPFLSLILLLLLLLPKLCSSFMVGTYGGAFIHVIYVYVNTFVYIFNIIYQVSPQAIDFTGWRIESILNSYYKTVSSISVCSSWFELNNSFCSSREHLLNSLSGSLWKLK